MAGAPRAAAPRPKRKPRSPANANRGEHALTLGRKTYRLRPSYAAIVAIEEELGRSATELLRAANGMALTFSELGVIAAELIRAGAEEADEMTRNVSAERIGEMIFEEGRASADIALTVALAAAVSGGRTASGEAKPVAETTG